MQNNNEEIDDEYENAETDDEYNEEYDKYQEYLANIASLKKVGSSFFKVAIFAKYS